MATATEKKVGSRSTYNRKSGWNEIVSILLGTLAILIFLCLVSYSPLDRGLNSTGLDLEKTHNWIGVFGAYISDLIFAGIGLTAYLAPAILVLIGWRIFRSATLHIPFGRLIGYFLLFISLAGLFSTCFSTGFGGGILGRGVSIGLAYFLGTIGSVVLLIALFLASVLLITNLSYLVLLSGFQSGWDNLAVHFRVWMSDFSVWRKRQRDEALERQERRRESRDFKEYGDFVEKEKPTISKGDIRNGKGKSEAKRVEETVIATAGAEVIESIEDNHKFVAAEVFRPKIIVGEQLASPNADTAELPDVVEVGEANKADSNFISISPIKETGELERLKIEKADRESSVDSTSEDDDEDQAVAEEKSKNVQTYENYVLPPSDFLTASPPRIEQNEMELLSIAQELVEKTAEFNVTGRVMHICQGPVVTTYEFKPDAGVKYSRITGLGDDLCLALKAESIRIDRIPGKAYVGIEVPNHNREVIFLRDVIESAKFNSSDSMLSIALGKSIDGLNYVADLTKMPHLLMAGQTGAGKSVGVNSIIVSVLYKAKPDEVKFIMVDPKQVELGIYADIPHLATPIITDPKRASVALKWAVGQMERRYKDLASWGVRNIEGYNSEVKRRNEIGDLDANGEAWKKLPFIVIIIDELADLMMVAGKEVEESITRLAQMARAVGIHLVLATQRPSVDVITGLIKANFPSRISFRVSSKVDSRTIIDSNGAESLLGRGDMLFLPPGTSNLIRVHGAYVDEKEITRIVEHIKSQGKPDYDTTITKTADELDTSGDLPGKKDPLFLDALRAVVSAKRASTSGLQRNLRIGYGRAAAILDAMVREGLIGEMDGASRARPILEKAYEYLEGYDSVDVD